MRQIGALAMAENLVRVLGSKTAAFLSEGQEIASQLSTDATANCNGIVVSASNEAEAGKEAVAGQFMDALRNAKGGSIPAEIWHWQEAPATMRQLQIILTGAQSKTQPRRPRITGESAVTGAVVDLKRLVLLTKNNLHGTHRQLVMAGGCGGWCMGARMLPRVQTACVIEWVPEICVTLEANVDAPVLCADLRDVNGTAAKAAAYGPYDSTEISSPCVDFSPSGKGIEGERAWITVTSTLIAIRLDIPLIFYENVPRMMQSKAWAAMAAILADAGYIWSSAITNAADCGVPQNKRRVFVAATKDCEGAAEQLQRWKMQLDELSVTPSAIRQTVGDVAPRAGPYYFFNARSSKAACIRSSATVSPTLRTNCGYVPKRVVVEKDTGWKGAWKYRAREADEAPIEKSSYLTVKQLARVAGFDPDFILPESRKLATFMLGNSAAPPQCTQVMLAARLAGLLRTILRDKPIVRRAVELKLTTESTRLRDTLRDDAAWNQMPDWVDGQWAEAAENARQAGVKARQSVGLRKYEKPTHPGALWPPRRAQAKWLGEFRDGCRKRGLPVPSTKDEEAQGLGRRDITPDLRGTRALITPDSDLDLLKQARKRIANLAENVEKGTEHEDMALCGIWRPIAGWPNANADEWEASGTAKLQMSWLRKGHRFRFSRPPTPVGCGPTPDGYNHTGAKVHAGYLIKVWAEYIVLGMVSESATIPASLGKLQVIPKGNYDPDDPKLCNRLRILLDEQALNLDLETRKYSAETLNRARHVIEEGDVAIEFDFSAYFLHFLASKRDRQLMGCTLGTDGPLGGRWWVWNVAPMGIGPSCYQTQSYSWVLMRKYRRLGIRGLSYSDDTNIFCKPCEAKIIAEYIESDFDRHGLLKNSKCQIKGAYTGIMLGTGYDLESRPMLFTVPEKKQLDIVECAEGIVSKYDKNAQSLCQIRTLASVTGKIMATEIATGPTARMMTRACYRQIARETGVPVDATRRELKVAWDCFAVLDAEVIKELRFWIKQLPGHKGTPIHPSKVRAQIVCGADAGDEAYGGFLDMGQGRRLITRDDLLAGEGTQSSSLREVKAGERTQLVFTPHILRRMRQLEKRVKQRKHKLTSRHVIAYSDSQVATRAFVEGSKNKAIQAVVVRMHTHALANSMIVHYRWKRRDTADLQLCDDGSKMDTCDFQLDEQELLRLESDWMIKHTVDGFATAANALKERFFSQMHCLTTAGVDFFFQDLDGEDVWAHPPRHRIAETVRRLQICGAVGTILVPMDRTQLWWPLVAPGARGTVMSGGQTGKRRHLRRVYKRRRGLLRRKGRMLPKGYRDLLAVRLDFRDCNIAAQNLPTPLIEAMRGMGI